MSNLGRQWKQLDMYKPAKELRQATLLDVESAKTWDAGRTTGTEIEKTIMAQKLGESRMSGLYDSIKAHGVTEPVYVSKHNIVSDGHHRIASANDIDPNMLVPVDHG
jgi:hypothetical protein